jgi:4'-phosphopantetheinyl transferase EntD
VTNPFQVAWVRNVRFGVLAGVPLPSGTEPVSEEVLARLAPLERDVALSERGRRQIEFAGGRIAARAAATALGVEWPALLASEEREPLAPSGLSVSITHKADLAIALLARDSKGRVGIDLEGDGRARLSIASRICRPEELAEIEALPEEQRWPAVMVRFAVKEAVYKAVFPFVRHFFGFQAARVDGDRVTLFLPSEDPALELETELEWLSETRVLAMIRARREAGEDLRRP